MSKAMRLLQQDAPVWAIVIQEQGNDVYYCKNPDDMIAYLMDRLGDDYEEFSAWHPMGLTVTTCLVPVSLLGTRLGR